MINPIKKYFAEFVGTFALVFAGTGAVVIDAQTGALGNVGIALVFGFIVAVVVYAIGHISGALFAFNQYVGTTSFQIWLYSIEDKILGLIQ